MRRVLQTISALALGGTIAPPILFLLGQMDLGQAKLAMVLATVAWFTVTPFWMGRQEANEELAV